MPSDTPRVLVVAHPSVALPLQGAVDRLAAQGIAVRWTDTAAFHARAAPDDATEILLLGTAAEVGRARMALFPRLRAVVFIASGTESVDLAAARARGITVAHSHSEENAESMAEATVLLILASLYGLVRAQAALDRPRQAPHARMLKGRTLGLVGYGRIARAVIARMQGWGVDIRVHTARPSASAPGISFVSLPALLAASDVVSLHAGLDERTRGMIGAAQLRLMKPGAVLVNTARGAILDEDALAQVAAERGLVLALDTFRAEPLPRSSPLRGLPDATLTPHCLGHTVEGFESIVATAAENVARLLAGRPPLHARA